MDLLTFNAEIIKSIAWPLTVLALVCLLRKPIIELIPLLRKLKWKELELEFKEKVTEVEAKAIEVLPDVKPEDANDPETRTNLDLVSISPRAAIIETWLSVESAARKAIGHIPGARPLSAIHIQRQLRQSDILDPDTDRIFSDLRELRNRAAHHEDFKITEEEARRYTLVGMALARLITVKSNEIQP